MREFQSMNGMDAPKQNQKLISLRGDLAWVESDIEKLVDTLMGTNSTLLSYANKKIEALDVDRQKLAKSIADMNVDVVEPSRILRIAECLSD